MNKQEITTFNDFGLVEEILKGALEAGFKIPSPIQVEAIPEILAGKDLVGQAHTGTGKTAAFGLPAMSKMMQEDGKILVITPTRELATQVSDELYRLGRFAGVRTVTVYGGQSYSRQVKLVEQGAKVVVATPGRLLDLLSSGKLEGFNPSIVVLDEADEMLDMGFLEDIKEIFKFMPTNRQTLLFSATMPPPIQDLAKRILNNPTFVKVITSETTNKDIKQLYYIIEEHERDDAIIRLVDSQDPVKSIIFCRTKKEVDRLSIILTSRGCFAKGLHGDMEQPQREEIIRSFRAGKIDTLVATDVAARGLDIADVSHVFNYHIPFNPESYVHRIGRTGRAGKKGTAITLVSPLEFKELQRIKKMIGTDIEHSLVPTIKDLQKNQLSKLVEQIKHQPLDENASKILKEMEEEMDLTQISYKLISLLLNQQNAVGPDKIGVEGPRLERILSQISTDRPHSGGNRRGSGSYHRGGGGQRDNRSGGSSSSGSYNRDRGSYNNNRNDRNDRGDNRSDTRGGDSRRSSPQSSGRRAPSPKY